MSTITLPSFTAAPTRAAKYRASVGDQINKGRAAVLSHYQFSYNDFWNLPVSGTQQGPNGQPQPVRGLTANSDLTPADKLLLLGPDAANFLSFASEGATAASALNPGATIPAGAPPGFQFFRDPSGNGWVYLQQSSISGSTVTWSYVLPSATGLAAADAAGITVPSVLQPS